MKELIKVILRILILLFFITLLKEVSKSFSGYVDNQSDQQFIIIISTLIMFIIFTIIIIFLWKFSDLISRFIVGKDSSINIDLGNMDEIIPISFIILGITLFAITLPNFFGNVLWLIIYREDNEIFEKFYKTIIINSSEEIITLIISILLIIRKDRLFKIIKQLKGMKN